MTERLTEKITNRETGEVLLYRLKGQWGEVGDNRMRAAKKLGELEDAEEDGRLVVIPYKIGMTLFLPRRGEVLPFKVVGTRIYTNRTEIDLVYFGNNECYKFLTAHPTTEYIEREFYKTREEAEKALKEMKKNE